ATYAVTQQEGPEANATVIQQVGGNVRMTESLSVSARKELRPSGENAGAEGTKPDDSIMLKYRRKF
ncbi:MAG: hypothetical protein MJA29_04670, partial [Candidatus Omnitrophica bacterium]|nr:hypothetical protein [Candidatus Omnitrophota bacterium]